MFSYLSLSHLYKSLLTPGIIVEMLINVLLLINVNLKFETTANSGSWQRVTSDDGIWNGIVSMALQYLSSLQTSWMRASTTSGLLKLTCKRNSVAFVQHRSSTKTREQHPTIGSLITQHNAGSSFCRPSDKMTQQWQDTTGPQQNHTENAIRCWSWSGKRFCNPRPFQHLFISHKSALLEDKISFFWIAHLVAQKGLILCRRQGLIHNLKWHKVV